MEIMALLQLRFLVLGSLLVTTIKSIHLSDNEDDLRYFLATKFEQESTKMCYKVNIANWNYETDIGNDEKEKALLNATLDSARFTRNNWEKYFKNLKAENFNDEKIRRQVRDLMILGGAALDKDKLEQLTSVTNEMTNIYSTAKICPFKKQNCDLETQGLSLEPGIESILSKSTDYDELVYAWTAWRNVSGAKMKNSYKTYIDLSNEEAKSNNFSDHGAWWRHSYESPDLINDVDQLWDQIEPLYAELHKYVSSKLKQRFGDKLDISDGLIPAHVFGNMWAQEWASLAELVRPFPSASRIDVNKVLKEQNYTVLKLFETADHFYQSLGFPSLSDCYDEKRGAMINKPTDGRKVLCHASAWDFCDGRNFRIRMCTEVTFEYFVTIHHEMGHIEYYRQYRNQSYVFRNGAHPGFHEAVGDTMALSVITPKHLEKIGLLKDYVDDYESSINSLMDMALSKIAFLPFGLLVDKWRWDVFAGNVPQEKWNSHWWDLRKKYQKVKPPVERSNELDFDPGAKYHVAGDSEYIAYFLAHILQFQFYRACCEQADEYHPKNGSPPLHKCDFYGSQKAGNLLSAGLSLGSSEHWSKVLEIITGEKTLDVSDLLRYFSPLQDFLVKYNSEHLS